jgi:predicted nucleic acid-binding protein
MNIILDTNIFAQDFMMTTPRFELLLDYLKKTKSKLIMPQIVYQEIISLYTRRLKDKLKKFKEAKEHLESVLLDVFIPDINLEISVEVEKYLSYLKEKIKISDKDIVPYEDHYLKNAVHRVIWGVKPCSEKRKEFRDVLLWLSVLDIALREKDKKVVFISNNTKDFTDIDKRTLHPDLLEEAHRRGVEVKYYPTIDDFNKAHAVKIDFITKEWILSVIDFDKLFSYLSGMLEKRGEYEVLKWAKNQGKKGSARVEIVDINPQMFDMDYYVIEKSDGSYYVGVDFGSGVVGQAYFYEESEEPDEEYVIKVGEDEIKSETVIRSSTETREIIFLIEVCFTIGLTIKDKKVIKTNVIVNWVELY